jgi:hypothetical protein
MVQRVEHGATVATNHCLVVGVTRDRAEVWLLQPGQTSPLAVVVRDEVEAEHRHVRPAQQSHGHDSNEGFEKYFADLARILVGASELMIAGHGKGKANAMEEFAEYLREQHPALFARVSELRYVDISHTTGRQLAALAREWKHEQSARGFGRGG